METTNLRDFFTSSSVTTEDDSPIEPGTVVLERGHQGNPFVIFRKEPQATVFFVGEGGGNIVAVQKPSRVLVPLVEYRTDPEATIQGCLLNLLEASGLPVVDLLPEVQADQLLPFLRERLGKKPLRAVLTNEVTAGRLPAQLGLHKLAVQDGIAYGVSEPQYVGHIVTDARMSGGTTVRAAILSHGGVVGVRIRP